MWKGKAEVLEALGNSNTVLLDVRDSIEWKVKSSVAEGVPFVTPRKGRLPGATHILWKDFMETRESGQVRFKRPEEIRSMCEAKGVTPDKEVIVYCLSGVRASNTYLALKESGFENVTWRPGTSGQETASLRLTPNFSYSVIELVIVNHFSDQELGIIV